MTSDYYAGASDSNITSPNWGTLTITGNEVVTAPFTHVGAHTAKDRDYAYDNWDEKPKERRENMRGLYRIIVVNPKTEEIGVPILVIAKDETGAMVKAALGGAIKGKVEDYDILIDRLGDVRAKKDVQKVKVVKEEEE